MQLRKTELIKEQCYVDGEWIKAINGAVLEVRNPATEVLLGHVPGLGGDETRRAVAAAEKAFPAWRKMTAKERSGILRRWFDLIIENQEELAVIMTAEQGKPLAESRGEIAYAASFVEWFAEEGKRIYGDTIPMGQLG